MFDQNMWMMVSSIHNVPTSGKAAGMMRVFDAPINGAAAPIVSLMHCKNVWFRLFGRGVSV